MHKIIYKDKEYNTYKEIWRVYGLKCSYNTFIYYIKNHGLEKAMDRYLPAVTIFERYKMIQDQPVQGHLRIISNQPPKIIYKGKEYNSITSLYNAYKDKIFISYRTFYDKIKMHLEDIDGFMDEILEEE